MELEAPEEVFSISEYVGPAVPPAPVVTPAPAPVPVPVPVAAPAPKPAPKPLVKAKPAPAPLEDEWNQGSELDDAAARVLSKAKRSSPWWLISLAFHAGIFALLPIFIFSEQFLTEDSMPIQIGFTKARWDPDRSHARIGSGSGPIGGDTPLEDPPIVFPGAERSTKNESANDDDHKKMKGDAADALAYNEALDGTGFHGSNNGRVTTDSIGVGGGGASSRRFGGRFGGRKDLVARGGGSGATESAVEAGLRWLARHQSADGGWHSQSVGELCVADPACGEVEGAFLDRCDTGVTALAVLAFLGAGYTPLDRSSYRDPTSGKVVRPGEVARRGLEFLIGRQTAEGGLDEAIAFPYMYDQALTTLALCEAYALTNAVHFRAPAQRGVSYLERARNRRSAWRYEPNSGESDVSVTGACVQALKSAKLAGLTVSADSYDGVRRFLGQMTNKAGRTGYTTEEPAPTTTLTIVGLYCRLAADREDPTIEVTARDIIDRNFDSIKDSRTRRARRNVTDYYSWYYAMLSFYDLDGPSGPAWRKLNDMVTASLMKKQELRGCREGSWDASNDLWCCRAGRTCATAMNVLTLEVYYRYAPTQPKAR